MTVERAVACAPFAGETESGDAAVVGDMQGTALTVATFDAERLRMSWPAVGDVARVLVRADGRRESVVARWAGKG